MLLVFTKKLYCLKVINMYSHGTSNTYLICKKVTLEIFTYDPKFIFRQNFIKEIKEFIVIKKTQKSWACIFKMLRNLDIYIYVEKRKSWLLACWQAEKETYFYKFTSDHVPLSPDNSYNSTLSQKIRNLAVFILLVIFSYLWSLCILLLKVAPTLLFLFQKFPKDLQYPIIHLFRYILVYITKR